MSATNGIRDEPPANNTTFTSPNPTPAASTARRTHSTVSRKIGRIMSSNSTRVIRTCICTFGNNTDTDASESADNDSFANTHSARNRANAARTPTSPASNPPITSPTTPRTCVNTASSKSIPPNRSIPCPRPNTSNPPTDLRNTAASKVPPPKSYTATTSPTSTRAPAANCNAAATGSDNNNAPGTPANTTA